MGVKRHLAVVCFMAAIVLLVAGALGDRWWTRSGETQGLASSRICDAYGHCTEREYELPTAHAGRIAFAFSLASAALCALSIVRLSETPLAYVRSTRWMLLLTIVGLVAFVTSPNLPASESLGSFHLCAVGVLCALCGCVLAERATRTIPRTAPPHELEDLNEPPCPACHAPAVWRKELGRHHCERCRLFF
jgi:hypothetical protein